MEQRKRQRIQLMHGLNTSVEKCDIKDSHETYVLSPTDKAFNDKTVV